MKNQFLVVLFSIVSIIAKAQSTYTVTNNTSCDILVEEYCILKGDCSGLPPDHGPLPPGGATLAPSASVVIAAGFSSALPSGICPTGPFIPAMDVIYRLRLVNNTDCDDQWLCWFGAMTPPCATFDWHTYNQQSPYPADCPCALAPNNIIYAHVDASGNVTVNYTP